jgi:SSS family solute:Na+ symporter
MYFSMLAQGDSLPAVDIIVIVVYILGIVAFGAWFHRKSTTLEGFTVGSRNLPGWAIGLSILATYLSSISFIANPGKSYLGNWSPFVFSLTIPISCWVSARYFIPLYRSRLQTTAYQHLENRFGYWSRAYCGIALILLQIGRIAVVLYLVSLAVHELLGWDIVPVMLVLGVLTIMYTVVGGIEAVIWTDVVQAVVLFVGGLVCVVVLLCRMPGGPQEAFTSAWQAGKFSFGGWDFNLVMEGFWVIFIFGIVENLRNFGIDQNYVQRFLAAKSDREAKKSLWLGGLMAIPVSALLFLVGTLLFVYYGSMDSLPEGFPSADDTKDKVFPFFMVTELPAGLTGLLIAAVMAAGMSTLDSSINVSATVWVMDFYKPLINPQASDARLLNMTRLASLVVGLLGTASSLLMLQAKAALDTWWTFSGVFGGAMLGLFLVGILVRRATPRGAVLGALAGVLIVLWGTTCADLEGGFAAFNYPLHKFMIGPLATVTIVAVAWLETLVSKASD